MGVLRLFKQAAPDTPAAGSVSIYVDEADGALKILDENDVVVVGSVGTPVVRGPFEFAFDTPNLNDGVAFYTPTVGDFLLDAWFEVDTAFDGTTPLADIGTGVGTNSGLFAASGSGATLLDTDDDERTGTGLLVGGSGCVPALVAAGGGSNRVAPARFTAANPLLVWASQDGLQGGAAVGGAAGAARVYIVTATPVPF